MAEPVVLPVGFPLGPVFAAGQDMASVPCVIRLGEGIEEVTSDRYKVWVLAFHALSEADLITRCHEAGVTEAADAVAGLLGAGLLVRLSGWPVANRPVLEGHRLLPSGVGLGNTADHPEVFTLAFPGVGQVLRVDHRVYGAWSLSTRGESIAMVCRHLAAELECEPEAMLDQLALNLPALVGNGLAYLDQAPRPA